ncbi:serine/threonine protein kinase [Calothrix sp. FACHB-1219]|uniref:serine/threonine-protein kinase n=1 Tax=unclassified Calothrix TaxID=2619626 RepID=UPI00168354B2|nr:MULTISPECIES: serine/threonine-protein kinase [unclassified Calothrix]MBD2202656.1 serine/threonine protein kinase [Calothrix sp. FACHB-168]MBD2218809.1 serine/threonine protein kinase [Calothrix sp. FACHB-1219]
MKPEIKLGTLINNRYLIQKLLGQGGFGRTYLAIDTQRFGEPCVVKEFVPTTSQEDLIRKSRELFEREAKVLYQIQHPQVPKFLAWLTENERLFIVQEYIDGKNFAQILHERLTHTKKAFSEAEVKAWLLNILPVLEYIHDRDIVHRDISLENIMLPENQSQPVLIDFGVVKEKITQIFAANSPNYHYSVGNSIVGKIGYSPPEQLRLGKCYPCSDIYALGVCAIVLLTGKIPSMLMDRTFCWQWRYHTKVSDYFANILDKMVAEVPSDRYQSAREIIVTLNKNSITLSDIINDSNSAPTTQNNISHPQQKPTAISHQSPEELIVLDQHKPSLEQEIETTNKLPTQTPVAFNSEFLEYCQRELASFVGPFASFLMKHTLQENPQIAPKEFIEVLTAAIPDSQRAKEFSSRINLPVEPNPEKLQTSQNSQELLDTYPAISNPEFLENCRRELNSFVGPFGSVILKDTLDNYPQITSKQLIETLVAEIPNQQRAEQFRQRIYKLKFLTQ